MSDAGVRRLVRLVSLVSAIELGYIAVVAILILGGPSDPESQTGWAELAANAFVIGLLLVLGSTVIRLAAVWVSDDPRVPRWTMLALLTVNSVAVIAGVWAGISELDSGGLAWWIFVTLITAATGGIALFLLAITRGGTERVLLMD